MHEVAMVDLDTTATGDDEDERKNSATKDDEGAGGDVNETKDDVDEYVRTDSEGAGSNNDHELEDDVAEM